MNWTDLGSTVRVTNLIGHPIRVFAAGTPEVVDNIHDFKHVTLPAAPAGQHARLAETSALLAVIAGFQVADVLYQRVEGLPTYAGDLPPSERTDWYVVPLPVALCAPERGDLLVNHMRVRDSDGRVLGCRLLATVVGSPLNLPRPATR